MACVTAVFDSSAEDLTLDRFGESCNDVEPGLFNDYHFIFCDEIHVKNTVVSKADYRLNAPLLFRRSRFRCFSS